MAAVYLYPSLCLFEGTAISVGRGTLHPFQQYGHPDLIHQPDSFLPSPMPGATHPKWEGQWCYGRILAKTPEQALSLTQGGMQLKWLIESYHQFPEREQFFNNFFNTLAGGSTLQKQIQSGMSATDIRKSWQPALEAFKKIRAKYLLYPEGGM